MASSFAGLPANTPTRVLNGKAKGRRISRHIRSLRRSGPHPCGLFIPVCIADLGFIVFFGLCELFANTDYWTWGAIAWQKYCAKIFYQREGILHTRNKHKKLIDYNC